MKSNVHVVISGKVQGVWFRVNTKQKAEQLGVTGWVKNREDGRVEAIFEGEEKYVKEMLEWCQNGPPLAKVDNVDIEKNLNTDQYEDFTIKY